jgi:hypothetical protein
MTHPKWSGLFERVHDFLDLNYPDLGVSIRMKFLSKVAEYLQQGLRVLGIFAPTVEELAPQTTGTIQTISKDLTEIFDAIVDAERIGVALSLKGPDKLKAAIPAVSDIILQSAALSNHKIQNIDLYNQGVAKVAGGAADIVNSLHTDGITVTNKQA